jgi:hypothetical protein
MWYLYCFGLLDTWSNGGSVDTVGEGEQQDGNDAKKHQCQEDKVVVVSIKVERSNNVLVVRTHGTCLAALISGM